MVRMDGDLSELRFSGYEGFGVRISFLSESLKALKTLKTLKEEGYAKDAIMVRMGGDLSELRFTGYEDI